MNKRGYGGKNAVIYSEEWYYYSSTNSRHVVAMFRISNPTSAAITWVPYFYYTCYGGWSNTASVTLNGANTWSTTGTCQMCTVCVAACACVACGVACDCLFRVSASAAIAVAVTASQPHLNHILLIVRWRPLQHTDRLLGVLFQLTAAAQRPHVRR